jgi:hypothetical protein
MTENAFRVGVNVPAVAQRTVTATLAYAWPLVDAGAKRQFPALPEYEKSDESKPEKSPLNLTVKVNGEVTVVLNDVSL